jgi:predicted amidophosphoribosyltransferase
MRALLLPSRCLACRRRADMPWCEVCATEVRRLPAGCERCAAPGRSGHGCWPFDAPIDATVSDYAYEGPVAAAILTAKDGGARRGWGPLAAPLAARLAGEDHAVDAVTWVTSVPARVRERGIDHARAIAQVVAPGLGAPLVRLLEVLPGRAHAERYRATVELPGTAVALVDDVLTTGVTAWRAAAALRDAGADRVVLVTLARAGGHPLGAASLARAARSPRRTR